MRIASLKLSPPPVWVSVREAVPNTTLAMSHDTNRPYTISAEHELPILLTHPFSISLLASVGSHNLKSFRPFSWHRTCPRHHTTANPGIAPLRCPIRRNVNSLQFLPDMPQQLSVLSHSIVTVPSVPCSEKKRDMRVTAGTSSRGLNAAGITCDPD